MTTCDFEGQTIIDNFYNRNYGLKKGHLSFHPVNYPKAILFQQNANFCDSGKSVNF